MRVGLIDVDSHGFAVLSQEHGKMKQIDLFGNETEIKESPKTSGRRYTRMQERHGILPGKTCKTCKHCIDCGYHGRTYYKCELWIMSNSAATDIRLKDAACGKYEDYRPTKG